MQHGGLDDIAVNSKQDILKMFSRVSHAPIVPSLERHKKLVCFTAMIQQDSIGNQFFVPLAQDRNGEIINLGMFSNTCLDFDDNKIISKSSLMDRNMVVVSNLPWEQSWNGKILVLVYGQAKTKINDIVQITGIYYDKIDKNLTKFEYPYNLPTIHALSFRSTHENFICIDDCISMRSSFFACIKSALEVDEKTATLLLLGLLSRVSLRTTGVLTSLLIGYFPLSICIQGELDSNPIITFLSNLYPRSQTISLDHGSLENESFVSLMNYESEELEQGLLQVPDDTLIIIDETRLSPGKLSEKATKNLRALIELVTHQQIHYDFGGHPITIPMNVPIISLSRGKSILPLDYYMKIRKLQLPSSFTSNTLTEIQSIQAYISYCRSLQTDISPSVAKQIESIFIEERSKMGDSESRISANYLNQALNCSRLIAASYGSPEITIDHFFEARLFINSL